MEPNHGAAAADPQQDVVARIEQRALRLSALLREVDNHPIDMGPDYAHQLDDVLELLGVRIAATRALLHPPQEAATTAA